MATAAPVAVIGRDEELATLRAFLSSLASGSAGLALVGEAGVGKTTLWRAALEAARERGYRVLEARPVEAEARLAFAALGDLFHPALAELLTALPAPQADALEVALLLERPLGSPPDERAVAVSVLSALGVLARERPVLVAVDDLQWLDTPSAAVLGYAWRRVHDERVGLLASRRADEPVHGAFTADERVRRLDVGPLSLGALHRLIRERLGVALSRPVLRRVHVASAGNQFFALEIARAFERSGATLGLDEPLPIPEKLHELPGARLARLPLSTRQVLLAAAALSEPTTIVLGAALGGDIASRLEPAVAAHVVHRCSPQPVRPRLHDRPGQRAHRRRDADQGGDRLYLGASARGVTDEPASNRVPGALAARRSVTQARRGSPEHGKRVFLNAGCGTCHTFRAAGTTKVVGPNLDLVVGTYDEAFIHLSIVDPGAYVEKIGNEPGSIGGDRPYHATMPSFGAKADTPGQRLTDQQLADVVAFLMHGK